MAYACAIHGYHPIPKPGYANGSAFARAMVYAYALPTNMSRQPGKSSDNPRDSRLVIFPIMLRVLGFQVGLASGLWIKIRLCYQQQWQWL